MTGISNDLQAKDQIIPIADRGLVMNQHFVLLVDICPDRANEIS
ncbi:hypothetical protein [Castellaniella caeni]